jgi:hypothetical protein
MGKIRAENFRRRLPCSPLQGKSHVTGAAAQVEHPRIRPAQNVGELSRRAAPPNAVDVAR